MSFRTIVAQTDESIQDALKVRVEVFVEEQQISRELEFDGLDEKCIHFVSYDGEQPIAAGRLRIIESTGKVQRICVLSNYRGKKIGNEIMYLIHKTAKEKGLDQLVLHAQESAIPFYEKLGYKISSELFFEAGIPHAEMKLKLN
ncbi:GNAT family N-acetyltransferase [Bacillus sp. AFS055030]|uniref:GNAT family N-acetyltransferase n=1 Tax=Bacillus sp. AFS055030 TaxID=2033507 RepID=UPI000BFDEFAE|nr:GNAT family N-acetyltransferase [Bacillus sp. AFS055030]PGL72963.1 GNAT family N-acetyltransferase [Bacillus sp. AFS055030]